VLQTTLRLKTFQPIEKEQAASERCRGANPNNTRNKQVEDNLDTASSVISEILEDHNTMERTVTIQSSVMISHTRHAFETYAAHEARKLQRSPGAYAEHHSHMECFRKALADIETSKHRAIASLSLAIGDASAFVLLKQAIQSARSLTVDSWFCIGRDMLLEQRLEAIYRLDICMAHLRIARWLHIHKLYETLARNVRGRNADDFVNVTNVDRDQALNGHWMSPRRGNPRNIEKASITRRIGRYAGGRASGSDSRSTTNKYLSRLRRTGERLQLLINRWGLGVLCLLGTGFTDNL
jgi:hypothetical protein